MHKITKYLGFAAISIAALASCSSTSGSKIIEITTPNTTENKVINPNDVVITETLHSLEEKTLFEYQRFPSTGENNLLVIPVILPGYEWVDIDGDEKDDLEKIREDIEDAFFGTENNYYKSVSDFYKESSYNKLNIKGEVTPWFSVIDDGNFNFTNAAQIDLDETQEIAKEAVAWAQNVQGIDLTKYDNDKDGCIDGVWLIYSAPNYTKGGPQTDGANYWAYTSYIQDGSAPNLNKPIISLFGWASYDFMYNGISSKADAHTYIHEMGHFLGLNDYYTDSLMYSPIGRIDMMDMNVIDHNSYSKMLLGWTKPYIVTGNAKINLSSMHNENNFIVIPGDNTVIKNNEFDPFSEYILIEYYTAEGLNKIDSETKSTAAPLAPSKDGIRIYHVDNRKFEANVIDPYNMYLTNYDPETFSADSKIVTPITNNRNYDQYNYYFGLDGEFNLYDEIRLIEASNVDTFSWGGYQTNDTYFQDGDVFSMEKYGYNFFLNDGLNNGDSFSYSVHVGGKK